MRPGTVTREARDRVCPACGGVAAHKRLDCAVLRDELKRGVRAPGNFARRSK